MEYRGGPGGQGGARPLKRGGRGVMTKVVEKKKKKNIIKISYEGREDGLPTPTANNATPPDPPQFGPEKNKEKYIIPTGDFQKKEEGA